MDRYPAEDSIPVFSFNNLILEDLKLIVNTFKKKTTKKTSKFEGNPAIKFKVKFFKKTY
jgi:hypothetical protein